MGSRIGASWKGDDHDPIPDADQLPVTVTPPPAARRQPVRSPSEGGQSAGTAFRLLAALWLVTLFDPQWYLTSFGIRAFLKLPLLLFLVVAATLALSALTVPSFGRRWKWYPPLLAFIGASLLGGAFAPNLIVVRDEVQVMLLLWTLVVGTIVLVDTARRAELLLFAYALQFTWWGLLGARWGGVAWHPTLSNYDGFGSWMVVGGGLCSFLMLASDNKWFRRTMAATIVMCVVAVVSSFARGAFLAAIAVFGLVWLRSPSKGKTLAAGVGGVIVLVIAASVLFGGEYWVEMSTILEGNQEETGEDRWVMWGAGWRVFLEYPLAGSGPGNWGMRAMTLFSDGELGGQYTYNAGALYGRQLHSSYVTILAEQGILGALAFGWILVDFWRRNVQLRTAQAAQIWRELGGRFELSFVARGLEAACVGWMAAAALYSMAGTHWFYTILGLNLLLHSLVTEGGRKSMRQEHSRPTRRPLMRPRTAGVRYSRPGDVSPGVRPG